MITAAQFMPSGRQLELPSGKKIFIADIGHYKMKLQAAQTLVFENRNTGKKILVTKDDFTPAIDNSYYSNSRKAVVVGFTRDGIDYETEISRRNIYPESLEAVVSVEQAKDIAQQKADAANEAHNPLQKYLVIAGLSIAGIVLLNKAIKQAGRR